MRKNKNKIIQQLKNSAGFGSLRIVRRLPTKKRLDCETLKQQVKAIRETMNRDRISMREEFILLLLTDDLKLIAGVSLYHGTADEVPANVRDIIEAGIFANAYYIVTAHNHPSGSCSPSNTDVDTAVATAHALRFSGLELLDDIVVTRKKHYSLRENGLLRA